MRRIDSGAVPHNPADANNFVLPATMQRLLGPDDGQDVRLYRVSFAEGARTNWHVHDDAQLLFGLAGTCVVVDRAGTELVLAEGDVVVIEAGNEHWHGAAPGTAGAHLAINLGTNTTWLDSSAGE
ncbi:MAG: cupin domain-containing protein [Gemmatimonadales bacterium]|jgi:quercetin dioxygenase-like cupin family protein|nr:cupin domain-containing protein [Gemmatimonadales bacterium]MDG2240086.1 cupin domain-containing protein [Longimicrobiales bacterium]MBT3498010.1 cupin domain-containing protein [Gemmatimonadales bacterium]MBT3774921.1 cupin domain-containing protein [Gemmatimonadales bacterium]MBT3959405.1 cupin domain-containing protein [Gemmatimonadales bacterium]